MSDPEATQGAGPALVAFAPLAASLLATALVAVTGFDQGSALPPSVQARFYGFFLDQYPLFAFAIVYALARILAVAFGPGPASVPRRLIGGLAGLGLVLAACLHPTFGGLVLRAGFATGGIGFLNQMPFPLAYALGTAAAASLFGTVLGLAVLMTNRGHRPRVGWRRALPAHLGGLILRFLALWLAFAILGLAREAGIGLWPRRPLTIPQFGIIAGLLVAALLPHSAITALRGHTYSRNALINPARSR
ncbi:hypothetical protein [Methylobacterium segetis]|uniref:hypothetical protein n=1 Tax=Methylobacterium segetis TaxID=2488750 RepID=UPI001A9E3C50|nr:hypothetical protein [Methylobacterium segetis]